MNNDTAKIVHVLIHSTATLPVHGGVSVPVTTAFEACFGWDSEFSEWYVDRIIDTYYRVGLFDITNTSPHEFVRGEQLPRGRYPEIGEQENGNSIVWVSLLEAITTTTPNEKETAYAKAIFDLHGGRLKYNTVSTIDAV
jgi:hypothetical protein